MSELYALDTLSRAWLYVSECRTEIGMHKLIQWPVAKQQLFTE
jgi:hypothetical protein